LAFFQFKLLGFTKFSAWLNPGLE